MRALSLVDRTEAHCEVVTEAARRLTERIPVLAERIIDMVKSDCPSYVLLPEEELHESVRRGLAVGLATVPRPSADRRDLANAKRDGRRRAEQGVLLADLQRVYRHSVSVVWDGMIEAVSAERPDQLDLLMRSSMHVWACVNAQADAAAASYREAQDELQQQSDVLSQTMLGKLLTEPSADPELVRAVSAALDLEERGRYAVAVVRQAPGRPFAYPTRLGGLRFVWWLRSSGAVAVITLGDADTCAVSDALGTRLDGLAGVSPGVTGLASLGRARQLADLALASRPRGSGNVVLLEDHLLRALTTANPELARLLSARTFGPVLALDPADRDLLLETLAVWLDCDGVTADAALRLYCHRNTVINRLRRLERLTGLLLSRPRDVATLTLALEPIGHQPRAATSS